MGEMGKNHLQHFYLALPDVFAVVLVVAAIPCGPCACGEPDGYDIVCLRDAADWMAFLSFYGEAFQSENAKLVFVDGSPEGILMGSLERLLKEKARMHKPSNGKNPGDSSESGYKNEYSYIRPQGTANPLCRTHRKL